MDPNISASALGEPHHLGIGFYLLPFATFLCFLVPVLYIFPPIPATTSDALRSTHTKIGVSPPKSNLRDQYSVKADAGSTSNAGTGTGTGPVARVKALCVYPIKSCRGIEVTRSKLLPTGLEFDRLYTFAQLKSRFPAAVDDSAEAKDEHTWEFVTQRQFPLLATIKVDVYVPDATKSTVFMEKSSDAWIVMRFPWREPGFRGTMSWVASKIRDGWRGQPEMEVLLPVEFPTDAEIAERGYTREDVKVWKEVVPALNMDKELPGELCRYLGVSNKLALFRVDPGQLREVYRCAPRKEEAGYQPIVGFQDAYPLHIMNISSLQDFDAKVPKDDELKHLDVRRFRSNIIVSGAPAYDEESWKWVNFTQGTSKVTVPAKFQVSCRTVRCKMPNVDPVTGARHGAEPDRSLRKLRDVDEGAPRMGCLGMQMCPLFEGTDRVEYMQAWLEVGMDVSVLERGEHVYIKQ
ncbi:MOSC domain-containing protein [Colletotrichum scovillei]|uniref:MOSC domain-containing protein n=1 Tax=Colletotrichum scovillei TaxID=1209932 RepID=A0A9P7UBI3_9PEZI|nr:MOSC domain-containing protein [Colletotrichum scovillei]KAF4773857.1 MOSC domain-containing protein [Colletotrichum scovillei]KAG7048593.1 MOSC domain-containing protein [Colletotrichum scovillei]KAG7065754.1 MOSC domain-containing protein [Colletotrichum scovillei]KAG7068327.1 MOSC domain-containing protein [Colletotrichum scovillei]